MGKVEEARHLLIEIGMPDKQRTDLCCYVLLAMANVKETEPWQSGIGQASLHTIIYLHNKNRWNSERF